MKKDQLHKKYRAISKKCSATPFDDPRLRVWIVVRLMA